jgi:hypothetical protein
MLAAPLVVGIVVGGPRPVHAPMVVAALAGYLAFQDLTAWLAAPPRRRPRYRAPLAVYGAVTAAAGLGVALTAPSAVTWLPIMAVLAAISLTCTKARKPRSLVNDAVTMAAACMGAPFAAALAAPGARALAWTWLPQAPATAWAAGAALFGYFFGTAFYVKTMIRERNSMRWYAASVTYHLVLAALALWWAGLGGAATGALLAARAAVVPRIWPQAAPKVIGFGEVAATCLVTAVVLVKALAA